MKLVRGAYHPHEVAAHPTTAASADPSALSPYTREPHSLSISPDPSPPVWTEKTETDARYNACVRELVAAVRADVDSRPGSSAIAIGVLFGTHNWASADLIVDELVRHRLGVPDERGVVSVADEVAERVTMGQLYGACIQSQSSASAHKESGMTAALTNYLVDRTRSSSPFVIKYIPYGRLAEVRPSQSHPERSRRRDLIFTLQVMPYLSRRAIENKSVLGNGAAEEERRRAAAEIVARIFG